MAKFLYHHQTGAFNIMVDIELGNMYNSDDCNTYYRQPSQHKLYN